MKKLIYEDEMDGLDSAESFFVTISKKDSSVVIPYISLGVFEHPLNQKGTLMFIDRSLVVFKNVANISERFDSKVQTDKRVYYFGGYDMQEERNRELQIICESAYLQILEDSELSDKSWIPVDTPYNKRTMKKAKVKEFLDIWSDYLTMDDETESY